MTEPREVQAWIVDGPNGHEWSPETIAFVEEHLRAVAEEQGDVDPKETACGIARVAWKDAVRP